MRRSAFVARPDAVYHLSNSVILRTARNYRKQMNARLCWQESSKDPSRSFFMEYVFRGNVRIIAYRSSPYFIAWRTCCRISPSAIVQGSPGAPFWDSHMASAVDTRALQAPDRSSRPPPASMRHAVSMKICLQPFSELKMVIIIDSEDIASSLMILGRSDTPSNHVQKLDGTSLAATHLRIIC